VIIPSQCLVTISYYNAWPIDDLLRLLDEVHNIPSGHDFDVLVVVNRGKEEPIDLPDKYRELNVIYRENSGYNIGAWDHGWRSYPDYDYYLFLQDECHIVKQDWLKAFIDKAGGQDGLFGESMVYNLISLVADNDGFKKKIAEYEQYYGINNKNYKHLQTLILFATNKTMSVLNGFPDVETEKSTGVAVEVTISRATMNAGFPVAQVSFYPFEYIQHPQWIDERNRARTLLGTLRRMYRVVSHSLVS